MDQGKPEKIQAHKNPNPNRKETARERGNPSDSEDPGMLQEFTENLVDDEIPLQGCSHASSSHEVSLEPTMKRRGDLGKTTVFILISQRPKLRDLSKDQNYKGPMQKDAMAKPYLVLKILVT